MTSSEPENLIRLGHLKRDVCSPREFDGQSVRHCAPGRRSNPAVSIEGRFDLAYNAAHALALAALRRRGYRSENRYLVF